MDTTITAPMIPLEIETQCIHVSGTGVRCTHAPLYNNRPLCSFHTTYYCVLQDCTQPNILGSAYCSAHANPLRRNSFGALTHPPQFARDLMTAAEKAGTYTTGIESVRRSAGPRGTSINADCYGYDETQNLVVIQVRQCQFRAGRFNKVRKDYYLLGRVESGEVFAHPIESPARSKRAMASPEACVAWVLSQIWDCHVEDLSEIRRQGDIAFVPASLPKTALPLVTQTVTVRATHQITADRVWQDGSTYYVSRKACAVHTKGEHAPVQVRHGVFRVQAGIRAKVWGFTAPVGD